MSSAITEASNVGATVPPLTREQNQIEEVQSWFSDLNAENVKETAKTILASPYSKSRELAPNLASFLLAVIPIRPQDTKNYVQLMALLKQNESSGNSLSTFRQKVLQMCMTPAPEYDFHSFVPYLYFVRQLALARVVEVWDVVTRIQAIPETLPNSKFLAACYFLPEISVSDSEYYEKLVEEIKQSNPTEPVVRQYFDRFDELIDHNFRILKELIDYGVEKSTIGYSLLIDDVEAVEKYCTSADHSVNELIPENPFTPWKFVQWSPTLTEFAAFYGSLQCVRWLLDHNSKRAFLTQFAVAGGNWKIIQYCSQQNIAFHCCLRLAAFFRRIDVFNYIVPKLESFRLKKEVNYAMCRAVEVDDIRMFRLCIETGALVNFADENNETPLFIAAQHGNKHLLQYILSFKEVRKNVPNCWGKLPQDVLPKNLQGQVKL